MLDATDSRADTTVEPSVQLDALHRVSSRRCKEPLRKSNSHKRVFGFEKRRSRYVRLRVTGGARSLLTQHSCAPGGTTKTAWLCCTIYDLKNRCVASHRQLGSGCTPTSSEKHSSEI